MKFSKVIAFITFSTVGDYIVVEKQLTTQHKKFQLNYPYWSVHATHRKLRASFWYHTVFLHYTILCMLGLLAATIAGHSSWTNPLSFLVTLTTILCLFIPIAAFIYIPSFYSSYLPLLESCIEQYTGRQLEGIQKCKQQQYPVMTLMLIQHTLNRLIQAETEPFGEAYYTLMMKQYGVSAKMIDACQRIIILNKWDGKRERKRTEIIDAFDDAEDYFVSLQLHEAAEHLEALKARVLQHAKMHVRT